MKKKLLSNFVQHLNRSKIFHPFHLQLQNLLQKNCLKKLLKKLFKKTKRKDDAKELNYKVKELLNNLC